MSIHFIPCDQDPLVFGKKDSIDLDSRLLPTTMRQIALVCPDWFERARRVSVGGDGQPSRVVKLLPLASAVLMCGMMLAIV